MEDSTIGDISTEIMNLLDINISNKLKAVNNDVRFSILGILKDFQRTNMNEDNSFKKDPLYSREINKILLEDYDINITPQMLGQHLQQLKKAELIEEIIIKKEVPNKIGLRNVKAYYLKVEAFEDLLLNINFLSDKLLEFFDLYNSNQKFIEPDYCVLTIFNGSDKGKTFKVHKDESILIGRKGNYDETELASFTILLDNSYTTVSHVSKPHLKLFYKDDTWYILDKNSTNGTFISNEEIPKGEITKLKNKSFLKLSRGSDAAIIYCSF